VAVDRELASAKRHDGGLGGVLSKEREEEKRDKGVSNYVWPCARGKKMSSPSCDDHLG
jgi:hypothetical protein